MMLYCGAAALVACAILYGIFLMRAVDSAPAHVEPDIDTMIKTIEAEENDEDRVSARRDGANRGRALPSGGSQSGRRTHLGSGRA